MIEKYQQRREVIRNLVGENKVPKVRFIDGRVAEVKKGQDNELFIHDRTQKWIRSKVVEVFQDELGNKYYISNYHLKKHLLKDNLKKLKRAGLITEKQIISFIRKAIKQPQVIVYDAYEKAILFGRKMESGDLLLLPTAGIDNGRIETVLVRRNKFKRVERYKVLYSEVEGW